MEDMVFRANIEGLPELLTPDRTQPIDPILIIRNTLKQLVRKVFWTKDFVTAIDIVDS